MNKQMKNIQLRFYNLLLFVVDKIIIFLFGVLKKLGTIYWKLKVNRTAIKTIQIEIEVINYASPELDELVGRLEKFTQRKKETHD